MTRKEIEEQLDRTTESIARRFGAVERVARSRGGRLASSVSLSKLLSVAIGGLALGWFVTGIGRWLFGRRNTFDDVAEEVVERARRERERGADEETALRRALRDRLGSMPAEDGRSGGLLTFVMGYVVRTGLHAVVSSLVDAWAKPSGDDGESD